jgi:mRNA interferase RelE/StbE
MKVDFRDSFVKDLKGIKNKAVLKKVKEIIETIENVHSLSGISNLKKLKGQDNYFRLRVGDYRLGLVLKNDSVILVRFLNRKDIYKYFP